MNHKTIAATAAIMVVVFGVIVVCYPLIFSPEKKTPAELPPATPPIVAPH